MAVDRYTCASCEHTFEKVWTDEEALAASAAVFGDTVGGEDDEIVCETCWQQLTAEQPPDDRP